jgi:hypothetical protein
MLYSSGIQPFLFAYPPDIIFLELCTTTFIGVQFKLYAIDNHNLYKLNELHRVDDLRLTFCDPILFAICTSKIINK